MNVCNGIKQSTRSINIYLLFTLISDSASDDKQQFQLLTKDAGLTWYGWQTYGYDGPYPAFWTWGQNSFGELGLNDTTSRSSPTQVGSYTLWDKDTLNKTNKYAPPERAAELEQEPPRAEEEVADWFSIEKPDESDVIEEEKTMHQKMYEMATARYNPFSLGGSENCDSDISCEVQKHSPWPGGSENFQAKKKQKFTPENDPYGGY